MAQLDLIVFEEIIFFVDQRHNVFIGSGKIFLFRLFDDDARPGHLLGAIPADIDRLFFATADSFPFSGILDRPLAPPVKLPVLTRRGIATERPFIFLGVSIFDQV